MVRSSESGEGETEDKVEEDLLSPAYKSANMRRGTRKTEASRRTLSCWEVVSGLPVIWAEDEALFSARRRSSL